MRSKFTGTITLYKGTLKENISSMLPWIIGVVLLVISSYLAYENIFPELQDRQNLANTVGTNPAFALLFGKATDLLTAEGFTVWRSVMLGSFITALMSILMVIKLTRSKEDSGETELIESYPVGRYTLPVVGLGVAWTGTLILAILSTITMIFLGSDQTTSLLIALSFLASGVMFGVVAIIASQVTSNRRSAGSLAVGILGLAYLLRGFSDTVDGADFLTLISPLGWIQKIDIGDKNALWPIWIFILFSLVGIAIALILKSKRDFGQGLIADKPGNDRANLSKNIQGLALHLNLGSIITWTVAFSFFGAMFGIMLSSAGDSFASNENFTKFLGASQGLSAYDFIFEFAKTLMSILGIIIAIYGIQILSRLATEETEYRIEPLLAGKITRSKLFFSHFNIAFFGAISATLASGIAFTISAALKHSDIESFDLIQQALVTIPAILVHVGIAAAVIGVHPQYRFIAWIAIVSSFALIILGPILEVDERILSLTPFWHIVSTSQSGYDLLPSIIMIALTVLFTVVGVIGFQRRDIHRV